MQRIVWILFVLLTCGWLLSELPSGTTSYEPNAAMAWRRTRDGWQRRYTLMAGEQPPLHQLHPGVLAALEGLLSLAGMVAFTRVEGE